MKARLGDDIVRCVGYGHIGDGNMHLNITSRQYNQEVMDKIEPYLYQWTSEQKGSISAEHGMIQLSIWLDPDDDSSYSSWSAVMNTT